MTTLRIDDLSLDVRWSARRKTVQLTIERDGALTVRAPRSLGLAKVEAFVREKRPWLYRKLAEKEALQPPAVEKQYVSGEGFAYLGRSYRLLLVDEQDVPLKLEAGRFRLLRSEASNGPEHFVGWYVAHAAAWIGRRIELFTPRLGCRPKEVIVRDLGHRWGSCTNHSGRIRFHWAIILLPASIVEYVVVHELAHLLEPNHSPEFWLRVERVMPDYERRKRWLAQNGARYMSL